MTVSPLSLRSICVVTGTRAEYGLLFPVMKAIRQHQALQLKILATAMHLSAAHGMTIREMEADGFTPDFSFDMLMEADTGAGMGKSIGLGVLGFIDAFRALKPDCVLVLGDRFEILAAAIAAMSLRIPLAHLEGGHVTEGAVDDSIRHAITKFAHLHFTAMEPYRRRIIQLGENPAHVHCVGSTSLDNILSAPRMSRTELEANLGFSLQSPVALATFHPTTADAAFDADQQMDALFGAIEAQPELRVLFTLANADPGGARINQRVRTFAAAHSARIHAVDSLGWRRYISALALVDFVIGNSSSGLIEAPTFRIPTINIGMRQQGRIRASSVIDIAPTFEAIAGAIIQALSPEMRAKAAATINPVGDGHAAERIVTVLAEADLAALLTKRFHDLEDWNALSGLVAR